MCICSERVVWRVFFACLFMLPLFWDYLTRYLQFFCCSFHSESFLTGDFSVPFYMISLLYICPVFWIFWRLFCPFCDFLSFYVLFLELFSPFYGSNYIPLYLFFMYFCIATILGLIISILPLLFLGFFLYFLHLYSIFHPDFK